MRPARRPAPLPRLVLAGVAALLLLPLPLGGEAGPEPPSVAREAILLLEPSILPGARAGGTESSASSYSAILLSSLARSLKDEGFTVATGGAGLPPRASEGEEASALALAAGSAWIACSALSLDGYRLSYRISLYEAESGALVAADSFTVVAGLGALPLIEESARRVAGKAGAALRALASKRRLVSYRISLSSPDEGARVSLESSPGAEGIALGAFEGGGLELPYFPLAVGDRISLRLSAPSRRSGAAEIVLGEEAPLVRVPALPLAVRSAFYLDSGTGRLFGAGAGYRRYLEPDWLYVFAEDRLYAGIQFAPGSSPLLHDELWAGFGWYLVFPPESRFRLGAQLGLGLLASLATGSGSLRRAFVDLAARPVDIFVEWNLSSANAIRLSLGSSYSFGTGGAGLLGRRWIGEGPPAASLGWEWRR
jgi:hypothetical protein